MRRTIERQTTLGEQPPFSSQPAPAVAHSEDMATGANDHSAALLQTVLDMLPAGVAIYDAAGALTQINAAGERLTQQSVIPAEPPNDRQRRYEMRRSDGSPMTEDASPSGRARRGETFTDMEIVIAGGSGPATHLVTSGAPLPTANSATNGAVVVFQDVTALREAEKAARSQRELTDSIIETTPFGIAVFDATDDFRCQRHNAPFLQLVGAPFRTQGTIVEVALRDLFDAESGARVHAIFTNARESRQPIAIEEFPAVLLPDPEPRWYKWSLTPLPNSEGTIEAMIVSAVEITELVRARDAVRLEAARSQAILDTLPVAVVVFDADGHIQRTNPAAHRLYELAAIPDYQERLFAERSAMLALRDGDGALLPPERWPASRILGGETLHGAATADLQFATNDGRTLQLSLAGVPLRDDHGQITGGVAVYQDVTERRQLERQATAHAAQLEATFEAMVDGVIVYAPDGTVLKANPVARSILSLGTSNDHLSLPLEERLRDRRFTDSAGRVLAPEERPQWRILHGETITSAESQDIMIRVTAAGGNSATEQYYSMSVVGAPIVDADGRQTGAVAIWRDVTSRRALEQRVHGALDALLQMADALIAGLGNQRSETDATPEAAEGDEAEQTTAARHVARRLAELTNQVLGCQRVGITVIEQQTERLAPLAVAGLPPAQEAQWWAEQRARTTHLADITATEPEFLRRLERGDVLLYDLTQPPYDQLPNPYGITVMLIAPMRVGNELIGWLTLDHGGERHPYTDDELRLAGAVGQLLALVVDRDRLIAQREAARASAMALETANQRMDTFLGIAGHELRTPLTSIQANLQLTDRELHRTIEAFPDIDPKLIRAADLIHRTGKQTVRLERLVNELLDGARIQAGVMNLHLTPCDLVEIVRESVEEFHLTWPKRTITLEITPSTIPLLSDAGRIGQVFANFLTNALKYSAADRPVRVMVDIEQVGEEPDGDSGADGERLPAQRMARVQVTDQGPGLSPMNQQRIWDRFYRAPGIDVRDGAAVGVGLGLYISRTTVERLGGAVGVVSERGCGSTFWFTLPITETAQAD